MIIVPTRVCNTNTCNYCSVYKKDFDVLYFKNFSFNDFYEKLEIISSTTGDTEIRFFWWEPFLKFELIQTIIDSVKKKSKKYSFVINTNLTLVDEEKIKYIKENNIKLIISCNGKLENHSKTRGISIQQTLDLYKNIRIITKNNITHQINIVVDNDSAKNLRENILFLQEYLGGKNINLLPVNYNGWTEKWLIDLENSFNELLCDIQEKKLTLHFINKDIHNEVLLFNNEIVIDSDGQVYPSMIILETFFMQQKSKIKLSDMHKKTEDFKKDFSYFGIDDSHIYSLFINTFLEKHFKDIMKNDYKSSELFHNFLIQF